MFVILDAAAGGVKIRRRSEGFGAPHGDPAASYIRFFTSFRMTAYRGPEGQERGRVSDSSLRPEGQGADTEGGERPDRGGGGAGRKDGKRKRKDRADAEGRKKRRPRSCTLQGLPRTPAVTYSPTLPGSTIGAGGLNGSVRYGKRWIPAAIATGLYPAGRHCPAMPLGKIQAKPITLSEGLGLLVQVGFAIAGFTPPAYLRGGLPRPSGEHSSRRRLRA